MGSIADGHWLTAEQKKRLSTYLPSDDESSWFLWKTGDIAKRNREKEFKSVINISQWEDDGGK